MKMDIYEKHGFMFVKIMSPEKWKSSTFFPVVDSMVEQIKNVYMADPRALVFDISELEYIDSTFISIIIQTARFAKNQRNSVITPREQVRDILNLLGIDRLVNIYNSEEEWKKSL